MKKYLFASSVAFAVSLLTALAQETTNSAPTSADSSVPTPSATENADTGSGVAAGVPAGLEPTLPPGFHRDKPAYIIIKTDDLKTNLSGVLPAAWQKLVDDINTRKIKATIGIICSPTLEGTGPHYQASYDWIKAREASGNFEFWLHAYTHTNHTVNGIPYAEFDGLSDDEMKAKFALCQKLAQDKLGFVFHTFGPPGFSGGKGEKPPPAHPNSPLDDAVQNDPNITVWLYPSPMDKAGSDLQGQGKVTVLDRVWQVNIERPTFKPNYAALVEGYAKFPDREYFVIQGHPSHWKPEGWVEFDKILDFLQQQHAVFVTATEMADILKKEGHGAGTKELINPANQFPKMTPAPGG